MESDYKQEWDKSYLNRDNFLFYPHEEIIRFVSKYIRKRIGFNNFQEIATDGNGNAKKILDLGCGIGRHVIYCHEMGLDPYGIDLSEEAILTAKKWGTMQGISDIDKKFIQGDACQLPWSPSFFDYAISHGVLDSMPFETARSVCAELARVLRKNALFYCDLISGDDSEHAREYCGEEIVKNTHEQGTIQSYFNYHKIEILFQGFFQISDLHMIRNEDILRGNFTSRFHIILRRA